MGGENLRALQFLGVVTQSSELLRPDGQVSKTSRQTRALRFQLADGKTTDVPISEVVWKTLLLEASSAVAAANQQTRSAGPPTARAAEPPTFDPFLSADPDEDEDVPSSPAREPSQLAALLTQESDARAPPETPAAPFSIVQRDDLDEMA